MPQIVGDEQNRAHGHYHSWDDFLVHGFPAISGLSQKTGYAALTLAKSPALLKLAETELQNFQNLSNAFQLVQLERKGVVITSELITAAQTLPVDAFRQMVSAERRPV
jgi:hypothetical protein